MGLVKPFPVIETKTKRLPATGDKTIYYKVARIQSRNPIDSLERSTFQGVAFLQSNFGYAGSHQPQYMFSFGVRGNANGFLLKPSLLKVGDSHASTFRFEVYKDKDGLHYLYIVQPIYSQGGVFTYSNTECIEYWEAQVTPNSDYSLVWSSDNGDTQGVYEGGRRLLTEAKATDTYMKKTVTNRMNIEIREGWFHAENPLSITKRADIVTVSGAVYHGKDGPYQIIGKVPTGYEPTDETLLAACYLKDDGSFASIPIVISIHGEIIQLGFRINNNKDRTKTIISGTYQTIGGM